MNLLTQRVLAAIGLVLSSGQSAIAFAAAPVNQIPSCYAANKIEFAPPPPVKHYFILIDQTAPLDTNLQSALATITKDIVKPGTAFSIYAFSAYSQGRYLDLKATGVLEPPIPKKSRSSIGVKVLKRFDECMAGQYRYGLGLALKAELASVLQSSAQLQKSDVIAALASVAPQIRASKSPNKVVLVVSDMLENSSISSFYDKAGVRHIDPAKELGNVVANRMIADFDGASAYVMGAGMVYETDKPVYRNPQTMRALNDFWSGYFQKSNARLAEFGQPTLLNPVR